MPARALGAPAQSLPMLAYRFEPAAGALRVAVRVTMPGDGVVRLAVPTRWARADDLGRNVTELRAMEPAALDAQADGTVLLRASAGATAAFSYVLHDDPREQFARNVERPVVRDTFFYLLGDNGLVLPRGRDDARYAITLDWSALPRRWTVATSFGTDRVQHVDAQLGELQHALFLGGDYRLETRTLQGRRVALAIRGSAYRFPDAALADTAANVIGAERAFWKDPGPAYFLIAATPLVVVPKQISRGGEGRTNSFAVYLPEDAALEPWLTWLLAHEMFHTWNPGVLGRLTAPESELYWFTEGLTDFYAVRLACRAQLVTVEQCVAQLNVLLRRYALDPAIGAANADVARGFFTDPNMYQVAYGRGLVLGLRWDAEIRAHSGGRRSFDDVMYALRAGREQRAGMLSTDDVSRAVSAELGRDAAADVTAFVDRGAPMTVPADALGPCFPGSVEHRARADGTVVDVPVFAAGPLLTSLGTERCLAAISATV